MSDIQIGLLHRARSALVAVHSGMPRGPDMPSVEPTLNQLDWLLVQVDPGWWNRHVVDDAVPASERIAEMLKALQSS